MPGTRLRRNVKVQNNVSICEGVDSGDDVFLGPPMVFTNVVNPRSHVSRKHEYQRTLVKRGATTGVNGTVIWGRTLGRFSFIAAGAVVTRGVPSFALMAGVPARRVGWMYASEERLSAPPAGGRTWCSPCGSEYSRDGEHPLTKVANGSER